MTLEPSPFAPPTLGDAPAPPPADPPTLPPADPPTLPPAHAASAPAPLLIPAVPLAPPATPPVTPPATPSAAPALTPLNTTTSRMPAGPDPKRSRGPLIVLAGLAMATIAGAAWFSMSTTDESTDDPSTAPSPVPESATATQLDIAPQDVSSPIVAPIDDASEVVEQIDDNTEEAAALDLLGLDEAGNLVGVGHRYTWSSRSGDTMTTTVDDATGNYAFESSDGLERRMVDGTSYSRRGDLEWAQNDDEAFESVQRLGLDGPVTVEQILDPLTAEYASSIILPDGGTTSMSAEIDEYGLWSDYPEERRIWLELMGITTPIETVEPDSIIVIAASIAPDGRTVNTFTVTTSDVVSTYTLDEVFDTAPAIEVPAL